MNTANEKSLVVAASRVRLAYRVDSVARSLYGVAVPVLDERATLRRVSLFYRGDGAYELSADELDVALRVIRGRDDERVTHQ